MKPMRHVLFFFLAFILTSCSKSDQQSPNRFVTIGTGGVTGVYYPAGGAICRMVNKNRAQHNIRCNVESTGGSVHNTNALAAGELDVGIVQADVTHKAAHGQDPFAKKIKKLRALIALHPESVTLVARRDAGIDSLDKIRGKRVNIGNPGSGNARTASELLKQCGITISALALAGRMKAAEMPDALRDNKLDAYFYVVGHPTANIKDVATGTPVGRYLTSGSDPRLPISMTLLTPPRDMDDSFCFDVASGGRASSPGAVLMGNQRT